MSKVKESWCPGVCLYPDGDPVTTQEFQDGIYPSEPGEADWQSLCSDCKSAIEQDIESRTY